MCLMISARPPVVRWHAHCADHRKIRKEKVQRGNAMIHDALQPRQQQESRLHTDPGMQDHPPPRLTATPVIVPTAGTLSPSHHPGMHRIYRLGCVKHPFCTCFGPLMCKRVQAMCKSPEGWQHLIKINPPHPHTPLSMSKPALFL